MRIAVLPSNQHLNSYAGLPGATEEKWAVAVCAWVVRRLKERGAEVGYFHIPGVGSASTDELGAMVAQAVAWKPDYMLSVHSDAVGDAKQTGILMLMARVEDANKGQSLGRSIAARVGLPYRATWVYGLGARKILYLRTLRDHGLQGSLVEVGEHATVAEASWNWAHVKEIGVGVADALADYLGLREEVNMLERLEKLERVSQIADSYDRAADRALQQEIIRCLKGDPTVADSIVAEKDIAVARERKSLGLD